MPRNAEQLKRHRERQRLYVAKNRDEVYRKQREYASRPETKARRKAYDQSRRVARLIAEARRRAKAKGLAITITPADVVIPEVCPVLGIRIAFDGDRMNWPSIDRWDNTKGYVPENARVISFRANLLKGDATLAEIEAVARYMRA